ncbi:3-oxoacyl-ACP synthase III family protein [Aquimarina hainanensis]|uniref:3-oxoacyl-ACP synthase III family protein n=1 Tax=Aquimarina hainanensis TaxID=1578017 RepID=A0ABW5N6X5_9FLAO
MIGIKGLGLYMPDAVIPIEELLPALNEDQKKRIGVQHSMLEEQYTATEMAVEASKRAIEKANIDPLEIDLILSCQAGLPDYLVWQTAGKIQEDLNAKHAGFIDVYQGCCSFIAGMRMARNTLLAEENIRNILICSGEKWEHVIENRVVGGYVFSDGASAVLMSRGESNNIVKGFGVTGRGDYGNISKMKTGRIDGLKGDNPGDKYYNITGDNPEGLEELKTTNLQNYLDTANKALKDASCTMEDIDFVILPNGRLDFTNKLIQAFGIEHDKTNYKYIATTGDISSADAMVNYQRLLEDGSLQKNQKVLILSQGAGMTWASTILQV